MDDKLDKKLVEDFPEIFKERYEDMSRTCMCWGFSHGDGWEKILRVGCSRIQWYINQKNKENPPEKKLNCKDKLRKFIYNFKKKLKIKQEKNPDFETSSRYRYRFSVKKRRIGDCLRKIWFIIKAKDPYKSFPVSQVVATQVKQKYGTLRFYYDGGDDYTDAICDIMEDLSEITCEECGSTDNVFLNKKGWLTNLCAKCQMNN